MSNVLSFRAAQLKKLSHSFVDTYIKAGRTEAAATLLGKVDPSEYPEVKKLVEEEFISRGYRFPKHV